MPSELTSAAADEPPPDWSQMLRRGLRARCPRCGGGHLFRTYWTIRDRCPTCGLLFAREPGYFTGVYLLNLSVVLLALFVVVMAFAVWLSEHPDASLVLPLAVGGVLAVGVPIAFYPLARTAWSALDLAMMPMELEEILDAIVASDEDEDEEVSGDEGDEPDEEVSGHNDGPEGDDGPGGDDGGAGRAGDTPKRDR